MHRAALKHSITPQNVGRNWVESGLHRGPTQMHLSHFAITKSKPKDKPYKLSDGAGLYLLVEPNGSKLWRFRYRFSGRENMLTFGPYPAVSLGDAREKRDAARKLLAAGTDPSERRKQEKREAAILNTNTFGAIADEVLSNK